jgi:hypothetical protein
MEKDKEDTSTALVPTEVDVLDKTREEIKKRIAFELDSNPYLSGLKSKYGASKLEALITPQCYKLRGEDKDMLLVTTLCDTTQNEYERISVAINYILTIGLKEMLLSGNSFTHYIDVQIDAQEKQTVSSFIGKSFFDDSELFRFDYTKRFGQETGTLSFRFGSDYATKGKPVDAFLFLWKYTVADSVRLEALLSNEKITDTTGDLGLEIYTSEIGVENVGGYKDVKEKIKRDVFYPFLNRELFDEVIKLSRTKGYESSMNAVLFYGPPGTGKTLMAKAIAKEQGITFFYINLQKVFTKWYSETQRKLGEALSYIEDYSKEKKAILFIDEMDYFGKRTTEDTGSDKEDNRVILTLLTKIEGLKTDKKNHNLLLIGATNRTDELDDAIFQRFKDKILFPPPSLEDRIEIWKIHAPGLTLQCIEDLAKRMNEGSTGRDIDNIATIATTEHVKYLIEHGIKTASVPPFSTYVRALEEYTNKKPVKTPEGLYR